MCPRSTSVLFGCNTGNNQQSVLPPNTQQSLQERVLRALSPEALNMDMLMLGSDVLNSWWVFFDLSLSVRRRVRAAMGMSAVRNLLDPPEARRGRVYDRLLPRLPSPRRSLDFDRFLPFREEPPSPLKSP